MIFLALLLLNILIILIFVAVMSRRAEKVPADYNPLTIEEMKKHILWNCFYVNENDPRGWAPKTSGYGMTINFRTKKNARIFVRLIVSALLFAIAHLLVTTMR